jgi:hypothetical protein
MMAKKNMKHVLLINKILELPKIQARILETNHIRMTGQKYLSLFDFMD